MGLNIFLPLLIFFFSITPAQAQSASYYVSTSGSDSNAGSQSAPWRTIQKAIISASPGGVVNVLDGNYSEKVAITRSDISLQAGGKVIIKGVTIYSSDTNQLSNISVKGFEITNGNTSGNGIYVRNAINVVVENNYIHDVGSAVSDDGIKIFAPPANQRMTNHVIVRNNTIYHAHQSCIFTAGEYNLVERNNCSYTIQPTDTNGDADCFRYFGGNHIFRNNYCHDIPFDGVYVRDSHTDCFQTFGDPAIGHDILFEGNTCNLPYGDQTQSVTAKGWQTQQQAYNLTLRNNIVITNLASIFRDVHDVTIVNNTFVGKTDAAQGIQLMNAQNVTVKNNIFYHYPDSRGAIDNEYYNGVYSTITAGNNCLYQIGGSRKDTGDVIGDPLFVNSSQNDYHLQSGSVCVDKGVNVGVTIDKDGVARPQGSGYDIGAYEYRIDNKPPTPSPIPTPTPTPKKGDANGDGVVNESDYNIWLSHFGQSSVGGTNVGDFNVDGKVDGIDYVIWLNGYGK